MGSHQDLHLLRVTSGLSSKAPPRISYTPERSPLRSANISDPRKRRILIPHVYYAFSRTGRKCNDSHHTSGGNIILDRCRYLGRHIIQMV